jgi:iron complex outermembrane receptor protein
MPFVLNQMPSVVVNSDAGTGIGYTGIRVRGSDPTRINVTVNGIPLNDSESHGVFWVNMPDFASSVNNIQLQRGVGTSTNGAAAFGASLNLQTTKVNTEAYAEINETVGSFNTLKHTLSLGSGLLKDKFAFDIRLSKLDSDGFVDRASADLESFYASGAYVGKKSILRFNVFAGHEVTYQSWWGLPQAKLKDDRTYNYYTYDNEVDDYTQTHYQLHYSLQPVNELNLNVSLHYTKGAGFFEQYKEDDGLSDYNLPAIIIGDTSITATDLIRRRWLDNDFYGATYSVNYTPSDMIKFTLGGAWNQYDGDHFGEVIWARYASTSDIRDRYYESRGLKTDFNTYLKTLINFT